MPRAGERRISIAVAIVGMALAVVGVIFLASRWSDSSYADAGSTAVSVVPGAVAPAATGFIGQGAPGIRVQGGAETLPGSAAGDVAVMEQAMAAGRRDQRIARDELRLADIVGTTLPGLHRPTVTCAGLTCRISGSLPASAGPAREYFRSVEFSDAIFALGYSPGPNEFKVQATDTAILLYLKREN